MTVEERDEVRRRMPEAVLLPPSDPLRQLVVEHIAATDGVLEREWLELVQGDERLRVELARVKPPSPDLHRRLLDIPAQTQPDFSTARSHWWVAALVAAVVVIVALLVVLVVR